MAGPPTLQQFNINPGGKPAVRDQNLTSPIFVPGERGYEFLEGLIDTNKLYLDKVTRLLISSTLVKTNKLDPKSPLGGYSLQTIGTGKPNISFEGYMTVANTFLLFVSEVASTTHIDIKRHNIEMSAKDATLSIIKMMIANRKTWQFENRTIIVPVGLAIYKSIMLTDRRSVGGNLMQKVWTHLAPRAEPSPDEKPKVKFGLPI